MWRFVLLATVLTLCCGVSQAKKQEDFPLVVHIVRVDMAQGQTINSTLITGRVYGSTYEYHLHIIHIDNDPRELTMTTNCASCVPLHIGDYRGRWNSDQSLEIQFTDVKGRVVHEPFLLKAEKLIAPEGSSVPAQPAPHP